MESRINSTSAQRLETLDLRQIVLLVLAISGMLGTAYFHLDFVANGIQNLDIMIAGEAWPLIVLLFSILGLVIAIIVSLKSNLTGARLALFSAILGWVYYGIMFCLLFFIVSVYLFITPRGILFFTLPVSLLLLLTIYCRRVVKRHRISLDNQT